MKNGVISYLVYKLKHVSRSPVLALFQKGKLHDQLQMVWLAELTTCMLVYGAIIHSEISFTENRGALIMPVKSTHFCWAMILNDLEFDKSFSY